jgi:hypothetical protein
MEARLRSESSVENLLKACLSPGLRIERGAVEVAKTIEEFVIVHGLFSGHG